MCRLVFADCCQDSFFWFGNPRVQAVGDLTTGGRWRSPDELEAMQNSGRVQESFHNGATSVTVPPNPAAYMNAPEGDVFVQFDVPSDSVQAIDSSNGWGKIYGPNSVPFGQYYGITEMPPATNKHNGALDEPSDHIEGRKVVCRK
jgi:hypothetical protein